MKKFPNILFLMSDEHRFDISGFMGNPLIRTPNLDALSKDAVIFDNAYSPMPVCVPARQCMAMGQYPSECGVRYYSQDLPPESPTFARLFTEAGYTTAAAGKLHHHGLDQMQGWLIRTAGDTIADRSFYPSPSMPALKKYPSPKWSESEEIRHAGTGCSLYARRDALAVQGLKNTIYEHFSDNLYMRSTPLQPVLFYLGLMNPHYPYIAEKELFDYYLPRVAPYTNTAVFPHPFLSKAPNEPGAVRIGHEVTDTEVRRAMAAYYANIETADRQFGEIISELTAAGQSLDDWIIIYTSDHGEMLGEHSMWEKQKFFEGSVRIPLFIRYPARFSPCRIKENVNLIDLFSTLLSLAGIENNGQRMSRDLTPLIEGRPWDNITYSEYCDNLMIKKDSLKYHCYPDGSELLFDLEKNPGETENFICLPEYRSSLEFFRLKKSEFFSAFRR